MNIAGIGCRRLCPAEALLALIEAAVARAGPVSALAAPAFKRDEPGLLQAAALLSLPVLWVDDDALRRAQPRCTTRSDRVATATGHASIAEASALAAAGPTSRLTLPRIAGAWATCAVAAP